MKGPERAVEKVAQYVPFRPLSSATLRAYFSDDVEIYSKQRSTRRKRQKINMVTRFMPGNSKQSAGLQLRHENSPWAVISHMITI